MSCTEIKKLLSEYIDGALEVDKKAVVEEHLASCKNCSEEAALLKACVEKINFLEKVEAPEDFLKKVKERVERRSVFQEMMRGLFVPVRIKVPLELAGVAASVVLAIIILNTTQPQKQVAYLPQPADSLKIRELKKSPLITKEEPLSYSRGILGDERDSGIGLEEKPIELALLIRPKEVGSKDYLAIDKMDAGLAAVDSEGLQEKVVKSDQSFQAYGEFKTTSESDKKDRAKSGREIKEKLANEPEEEKRQKETALSDIQKSYLEIKKLVELAEGEIISVNYNENTNEPQTITINLPAENSSLFLDNLNQLGELQSPPSFAPAGGERLIRLQIQLIPAN